MTDAAIGYGTKYFINGTKIAEVFDVTPGAATSDRVDATHMESPGRRREYVAGLIDSGEASFGMNFVPGSASDALIRGHMTSGDVLPHKIEFPNGVTVTYDASVTGYERAVPVDDRMTATVTVAVSGDELWADA